MLTNTTLYHIMPTPLETIKKKCRTCLIYLKSMFLAPAHEAFLTMFSLLIF